MAKGGQVVAMNNAAIDKGTSALVKVHVPAAWKIATDTVVESGRLNCASSQSGVCLVKENTGLY